MFVLGNIMHMWKTCILACKRRENE